MTRAESLKQYKGTPAWVTEAKALWETGLSMREVGERIGKHPQSVIVYRSRDQWTRVVHAKRGRRATIQPWHETVRVMYEAGALVREISESVGRCESVVARVVSRNGWRRGDMATRPCGACGLEFPATEFPRVRRSAGRFGRTPATCRECWQAYKNAYKYANPDKVKRWHGRRATRLKKQSDGTLTESVVRRLFRESTMCPACRQGYTADRSRSLDHIVPLSRGGTHGLGNVRVCCLPCNLAKGARVEDDLAN